MNADSTADSRAAATALAVVMEPTFRSSETPPASYNGLPTELKLDIWEQAYRDAPGRVIHIQCSPTKPPPKAERLFARIKKYLHHRFSIPVNIISEPSSPTHKFSSAVPLQPGLHYVDRVSREVTMKRSERIFLKDSIHQHITADLSKDILLLSPRPTEYSIAPILKSLLAEMSVEQKSRLRCAAFEYLAVSPPKKKNSSRVTEYRLPDLGEPTSILDFMFTELSTCLEIIAFIGSYGEDGDVLGERKENTTLKFLEVRNLNAGNSTRTMVERLTLEGDMEIVTFYRSDWSVHYARKATQGEDGAENISFLVQLYHRAPREILKAWDSERNEFVEEIVAWPDCLRRAKTYIEQVARHYANVANGQGS